MNASERQKCIEAGRAARARAKGLFAEWTRVRRFARVVQAQVTERREQTLSLLPPK